MMKKVFAVLCVCAMSLTASAYAASDMASLNDRVEKSRLVIDEIMQAPDNGIPDGIVKQATCIAVVPSLKKGAFIIGGQYGQGVVTCRTGRGWSAPVFIRMAGGSFGFQIGGQGTDLVLVAVNDRGLQDLLKSKFKIGGDAAASAGPVGRNAQASTDLSLKSELLTYSRSKGLFAGIDLDGTSVSQNQDDTDVYYGAPHTFQEILKGNVLPPAAAKPFLRTVAKYFHSTQD
jgi:SH3 domain-containing YSC84-like protein 1